MADRVVQTSTRVLGRRSDRTSRPVREVGDSSIGAMDAEGNMEQWLHDKVIPWKERRHLLKTNSEHFRASHASRNGALIRMGYVVCVNDTGRWVWDFWVENPPEAPQVIYKTACVDFKLQ